MKRNEQEIAFIYVYIINQYQDSQTSDTTNENYPPIQEIHIYFKVICHILILIYYIRIKIQGMLRPALTLV